jgi:hypothetical protein
LRRPTVRSWLKPRILDPRLHGTCLRALAAADYDTAVFEAFKAVEAAVRKKAIYPSSDFGIALLRKALDPNTGVLTDYSAPVSRRQARQHLFVGAMGELRNPEAQGNPIITDLRLAIEEIMTVSLLLRIVGTNSRDRTISRA